nr:cytochrome d ubiquinol oxidase subunit II [Tatumella ptyseos]
MDMLTHTQHFLIIAWWLAFGVSVLLYIALDGADLGAGIFSLFVRDHDERGAIMTAMAGTWDANETWLIVAGGIMFGTFPFVYGSAFSYLMVPMALVLWALCPAPWHWSSVTWRLRSGSVSLTVSSVLPA